MRYKCHPKAAPEGSGKGVANPSRTSQGPDTVEWTRYRMEKVDLLCYENDHEKAAMIMDGLNSMGANYGVDAVATALHREEMLLLYRVGPFKAALTGKPNKVKRLLGEYLAAPESVGDPRQTIKIDADNKARHRLSPTSYWRLRKTVGLV